MRSYNRTQEWARVKNVGGFNVVDVPGEITVSSMVPVGFSPRLIVGVLAAPIAVWFGLWGLFEREAMIVALIAGVLALNGIVPFWWGYGRAAYKVKFTAEAVIFYNMLGINIGNLPRDGMMQIAIEPLEISKKRTLYQHVFYSDCGHMPAVPQKDARMATLRNNLLMTAFRQPVHLDQVLEQRAA